MSISYCVLAKQAGVQSRREGGRVRTISEWVGVDGRMGGWMDIGYCCLSLPRPVHRVQVDFCAI